MLTFADLCLTFEDKIRHEFVSKQWKRCVFQRQFVINGEDMRSDEVNESKMNSLDKLFRKIDNKIQFDVNLLESVLKKCPNIRKVNLNFVINSEVLSLIDHYCPRIKSLIYLYESNDDKALSFFRKNGQQLEELCIENYEDNEVTEKCLKLCPNLKNVYVNDISIIYNEDKSFLPKLERIESDLDIDPTDAEKMKILCHKYIFKQTKHLNNFPVYLSIRFIQ